MTSCAPVRGMGEVQPSLLVEELRRLPALLLLPGVHRPPLHETDRGFGGVGDSRPSPETLIATAAVPELDERNCANLPIASTARSSSFMEPTTPCVHMSPAPPLPSSSARTLISYRRCRARASRASAGQGEPVGPRLCVSAETSCSVDNAVSAPQARAVHLIAHRSRPRPARRGYR